MRPPSPDDPGRPGGTSHVQGKVQIDRQSGDKQRLRTITMRYAELNNLGLPRKCRLTRRATGHSKTTYGKRKDAVRAAREMAPILGFVQEVYQCEQHFHLATGKAARQASLTRLDSDRTEEPREGEQP